MKLSALLIAMLVITCAKSALAQQTIFNVPSADVLDRGKVYLELDAAISESNPSAAFTPRVVFGAGHNIEVGVNFASFDTSAFGTVAAVPTLKWKFYQNKRSGISLFAGDHIFLPVHNRAYNAGNYVYVEAAKQFKTTRIGVGVYDFTAHVVASGNRAGVQASIEQTITPKLSAAADWFSGNNITGYATPGIVYKLSSKFTLYAAYEIGNHNITQGNHAVLLELGCNLN